MDLLYDGSVKIGLRNNLTGYRRFLRWPSMAGYIGSDGINRTRIPDGSRAAPEGTLPGHITGREGNRLSPGQRAYGLFGEI